MANPNTPYGLVPLQSNGSEAWRSSLTCYQIPTTATSAIYVGDPVIKLTGSADVNGINGIKLAAAGTSNLITGVVCGFVGIGAAVLGQPGAASFWGLAGTPGPAYRPASASQVYYALVNDDPKTLYTIQSSGTAAVTNVGKNANLLSGAGSVYTGWSGWQLNEAQVATTSTYQVNILGVLQELDNVVNNSLAYGKFLVRINQSTEGLAATGI
jgi:hypothetical protein